MHKQKHQTDQDKQSKPPWKLRVQLQNVSIPKMTLKFTGQLVLVTSGWFHHFCNSIISIIIFSMLSDDVAQSQYLS
jgi:hypothetical protein